MLSEVSMDLALFINEDVDKFQIAVTKFIDVVGTDVDFIANSKFKDDFIDLIESLSFYTDRRENVNSSVTLGVFKDLVKTIRKL